MADIALPPPAPFLALHSETPIPWTRWLQSFETFILRRFLFHQRHQLPGESVQLYVANLRGLASTCKFSALQDEMIRDQLIEHTNDAKVRETLLLEPDDLSLSRAITIALRIESAAACASALTKQQTIADCPAQPSQNDTLAAAESSAVMLLRCQQRSRPCPQANVDAILAIPEPSSAVQVASFLGMTGYYLKFLPHYSATTAPLRRLLRKDEPWVWSQACSDAVRALKMQLTTAPVLAHFDISSPTWVICDASTTAIGAVL